ncbi:MAG: polysaccharide biosynthesis C-terminal domain-containing protein [Pseudomonadota bacterium]
MSLLQHLTGYAPARLAHALAAFGGVYVFTRLLGAEEYGRYALLVSLLAMVHTASVTWAEAAAYRFAGAARGAGKTADHYAGALRLVGLSGLGGLMVLAMLWIVLRQIPGYGPAIPVLGALLITGCLVQLAQETHRAEMRVERYSLNEVVHILGGFALGSAVAWQLDFGAVSPLIGLLTARSVVAVREGIWLARAAKGGRASLHESQAWFAYGAPVAAALVLDIVLSASDRFLIAAFLGEAAVGAYAAGYGVADKTVLMLCAWPAIAASPLLMARFEAAGATAAGKSAKALITTVLLTALPAATGLALVAQPLSEAMIGTALRDQAAAIIPWIAFAGLLNGLLVYVASEPFQLTRRTGLRAGLMLVPAILNIGLNLVLLPLLGMMGAVYATVISYGVGLVLLAAIGNRLVQLDWPFGEAIKIALACVAMAPAVWVVPNIGGWPQLAFEAAAGGAVYAFTTFMLDAGGVRDFVSVRFASKVRQES